MKKIDSYWEFERNSEGFEEDDNPYDLPQHNSHNFIDFDFIRQRLFILSEGQKGVEILNWDDNKIIKTCENFIREFKLTNIKAQDIVRICFDFENNMIMYKTQDSKEDNIYFLNLEEKKEKIIESMSLETIDMSEINNRVNALLLMQHYESLDKEDRIQFMINYIEMKEMTDEIIKQMENLEKLVK